ncbi:hypothetical protein FD723_39735 (plasmid) [Nostoc sp. C052]|uniref:hypothetical protein n=1 Tax=Nostoc sp. C052 TaxID=2576902 RepID=UPI0015C3C677|nr:hypothetical protein [Nostoc sp. C052]QLE46344.1 hypothetical protein FD723_39735 [Nostoc sp. C052]
MASPPIFNFGNHNLNTAKLPPNTTLEDISNFIVRDWEKMADFAYSAFLRYGKGMTLFYWDDPEKNGFYYFPINELYKHFNENVIESAKKYEPTAYVFLAIAWYSDSTKTAHTTMFLNVFMMNRDMPIDIYHRNRGKENSITAKN